MSAKPDEQQGSAFTFLYSLLVPERPMECHSLARTAPDFSAANAVVGFLSSLADMAVQQQIGALLMFKMTVKDVFVIRNRGVVATGRVECGTLRVGATVQINSGQAVTVDAIEKFRKQHNEANQGEDIGVLFKSVDEGQLDRGDVLTSSSSLSFYGEAPAI